MNSATTNHMKNIQHAYKTQARNQQKKNSFFLQNFLSSSNLVFSMVQSKDFLKAQCK